MSVVEITSKENPIYKELKRIAKDGDEKYIFVEGSKLFIELINSSLKLIKIFIDKNNQSKFLHYLNGKNCEVVYLANDLLSSVFTTDSKPEGEDLIIAIAERPLCSLNDLLKTKRNILFFENIQDPGNLGTSIRSALAFDCVGIVLSKGSVTPFNTKVLRASAGSVFKIPVLTDQGAFVSNVKKEGYKIIATSSKQPSKNLKIQLDKPSVFLFGNEGKGLSEDLIKFADEVVSIPHSDKVESLNLATSVSLILWESYRQKMLLPSYDV